MAGIGNILRERRLAVNMDREYVTEVDDALWFPPWQTEQAANQQAEWGFRDVADWKNGKPHAAFDPFCDLIQRLEGLGSLIDIGSGAGYYASVLHTIRPLCKYVGCDASSTLIQQAKTYLPDETFYVADAQKLPLRVPCDAAMLAGLLGHIPDYDAAISCALLAAEKYLILHRIPCHNDATTEHLLTVKTSYGQKMAERFFHENTLVETIPGKMIGGLIRWQIDGGYMFSGVWRL